MKDVVVTGDEVGVGVVGSRELLHGARLDQLLREVEKLGLCLPPKPGTTIQLQVPMHAQLGASISSVPPSL